MNQPVAPRKPAKPKGYVSTASAFWVLFLGLLGVAWLKHSTGFLSVFWYLVVSAVVSLVVALWQGERFDRTPEGRAYEAATQRYDAACEQYQHDLSAWQAHQYRLQLFQEAVNDWAFITGGARQPTREWVANRMLEIEREREQRAVQQQQLDLQRRQLQAQYATIAAVVVEGERVRRAAQPHVGYVGDPIHGYQQVLY